MIKADSKNGHVVIEGNIVTVLDEFTTICRSLRECLTNSEDQDFADRTVEFCVTLSRRSEDDLDEEVEDHDEANYTKPVN